MTLVSFVIDSLATWRLSNLLVEEEGPYLLLVKFRQKVGVRYDDNSERYGTTEIAKALNCIWCTSVWVGLLISILNLLSPRLTRFITTTLALSALAILIREHLDGKS